MSNLWLKTKDQALAERVKDQMPKTDLRWYVAESGDPEFPWGLFNELVRYGDGAMALENYVPMMPGKPPGAVH